MAAFIITILTPIPNSSSQNLEIITCPNMGKVEEELLSFCQKFNVDSQTLKGAKLPLTLQGEGFVVKAKECL